MWTALGSKPPQDRCFANPVGSLLAETTPLILTPTLTLTIIITVMKVLMFRCGSLRSRPSHTSHSVRHVPAAAYGTFSAPRCGGRN